MIPVIGFDPTKDPLAERIQYAGQRVNQGLTNFANGMTSLAQQRAQQQETAAAQEANRLKVMEGEFEDITRQADQLNKAGTPEEDVAKFVDQERAKVRQKYGAATTAAPAGGLTLESDALAGAPAAAPQGAESPAPRELSLETDALAQRPTAPEMPDYERGSLAKEPPPAATAEFSPDTDALAARPTPPAAPPAAPPAPAAELSFQGLLKTGREKTETKKQTERDKVILDREQSALSANGWEGFRSKIPGGLTIDTNTLGGARLARGLLEAYVANLNAAHQERLMRLQTGKNAYENESQLRREFTGIAKTYEDRIREAADVDKLASQKNNPADFALMQKFARMMSPGIVTDKEVSAMARPGGALESIAAEWNRVVNKQMLLPEQRQRIVDAVKDLERNARSNLDQTAAQYRQLATDYFGTNPGKNKMTPADRVVQSIYTSPVEETFKPGEF